MSYFPLDVLCVKTVEKKTFRLDYFLLTIKHKGGLVTIWMVLSCKSTNYSLFLLQWNINSQNYLNILVNQIHPIILELFSDENGIFLDNNALIHMTKVVNDWLRDVEHLIWSWSFSLTHLVSSDTTNVG